MFQLRVFSLMYFGVMRNDQAKSTPPVPCYWPMYRVPMIDLRRSSSSVVRLMHRSRLGLPMWLARLNYKILNILDINRMVRQIPEFIAGRGWFWATPQYCGIRGTGSERSDKITSTRRWRFNRPCPHSVYRLITFPTAGRMSSALKYLKGAKYLHQGLQR